MVLEFRSVKSSKVDTDAKPLVRRTPARTVETRTASKASPSTLPMMAIARSRMIVVVESQETMNNCLGTLPQNRVVWPIAPVSVCPVQASFPHICAGTINSHG